MSNRTSSVIRICELLENSGALRSASSVDAVHAESARPSLISLIVFAAALLTGCGSSDAPETRGAEAELQTSAAEPAKPRVFSSINVSGEAAYRAACAHCHDSGVDGAPVTGDADSWSGRSPLWEAVLADHAKNGYLGMPAKGGVDTLPDAMVSRAVEYMLLRTFPDRPPD